MLGSASTTRGFLLVEELGPWGPGGVPSSRLGDEATAALEEVAASIGATLLLVRRGRERVITRTCPVAEVVEAARSQEGWADLDTANGGPLLRRDGGAGR